MEEPGSSSWRKFSRVKPGSKRFGKSAKQLEKATVRHAHKFIISRYENIKNVRRHALGWMVAVLLVIGLGALQIAALSNSFTTKVAADGGVYAEGVIGQLDVINPLYASTQAERSASELVYSGLLGYDETGSLNNELAKSWKIERDGLRYVVEINDDSKWHDGRSVSADDVVFTTELMRNPATRAQQYQSWTGIRVEKLSDSSVAFELPRAYAAFPHALTFGVLPKHVFETVAPESLRESELNREPLGSGPFMFSRLQVINPDADRMVVYFNRFNDYIHDQPRVERFQLHTFQDSGALREAFVMREVNAAANMNAADLQKAKEERAGSRVYEKGIDGGVFAFMNNDNVVLKDKNVRVALVRAVDRTQLLAEIENFGFPLDGPLLKDQVPNANSQRITHPFNTSEAAKLLDKAGWRLNEAGTREKDGKPLSIRLVGIQAGDYPTVVDFLKESWQAIGVNVEHQLVDPSSVQQNVIVPRAYDVLVYELEIGADPDVFAFWHSSQAGPRGLNLSNYRSDVVSEALESAQERFEAKIRAPKYQAFVNAWVNDAPAVALYQPEISYIVSEDVAALSGQDSLPTRIQRYANVYHWTTQTTETYLSR